jgi:excisionase family DNA binding protein
MKIEIEIKQLDELIKRIEVLESQIKNLPVPAKSQEWYKLKEAAEYLNVSPRTVMRLIERGMIKRALDTWTIRIPHESLIKYKKTVVMDVDSSGQ